MTDMVERVARAIYEVLPEGRHWAVMDKPEPLFITHSWEKASEDYQQNCIDYARAAIEAAFQVTDEDARAFFNDKGKTAMHAVQHRYTFRPWKEAMQQIADAVLKES